DVDRIGHDRPAHLGRRALGGAAYPAVATDEFVDAVDGKGVLLARPEAGVDECEADGHALPSLLRVGAVMVLKHGLEDVPRGVRRGVAVDLVCGNEPGCAISAPAADCVVE